MEAPDLETIQRRIREGWSTKDARATPIRHSRGKNGKPNVARIARAANAKPSLVQRLMRAGLSMEKAIGEALKRQQARS